MNNESAPEPSGLSFEDLLSGKADAPDETGDKNSATAAVPPPLGDVDADPASNRLAVNIRRALTRQLRASEMSALEATYRVRAAGNMGEFIYHADVIVDAGEPDRDAKLARQPKVLFEVATPGTERAAFIEGWRIHEKISTVDVHVLADPEQMSVVVARRNKGGNWEEETFSDADDSIFLPTIHCMLTLETIYEEAMECGDEGRI